MHGRDGFLFANPEHRVIDAALPGIGGATPRLGEAAPIRESETACLAGAGGKRQFSFLTGNGFLDVCQVPVDIFFRYPNRLGDLQRRHGPLRQQVDDLLAKGSHGAGQDAFPFHLAVEMIDEPGRQATISLAQVS
jgi:hypothetical protein